MLFILVDLQSEALSSVYFFPELEGDCPLTTIEINDIENKQREILNIKPQPEKQGQVQNELREAVVKYDLGVMDRLSFIKELKRLLIVHFDEIKSICPKYQLGIKQSKAGVLYVIDFEFRRNRMRQHRKKRLLNKYRGGLASQIDLFF